MTDLIQLIFSPLGADPTNTLFAAICIAGLAGAHPRTCLVLTLWVHLALIGL